MSRLRSFKINWCDAWGRSDDGITSVLVIGEGYIKIDFLVNVKKYTLNLSSIEDKFIEQLEQIKIQELNGYSYCNPWVLDGDMWEIYICYDDIEIRSRGTNAYPTQFLKLIKYLHEEMGLPVAKIEEDSTSEYNDSDITITEF